VNYPEAPRSKLLSAAELAARFGVPKGRVYELAERGALQTIRIGRLIRFRPDEVEAFMSRGGERATRAGGDE
jgi:excisionase family DNA binding protein